MFPWKFYQQNEYRENSCGHWSSHVRGLFLDHCMVYFPTFSGFYVFQWKININPCYGNWDVALYAKLII
jgi:hypothetical protein